MVLRRFLAGLALLTFSLGAYAFRAVDELTPATSGRYPAYLTEPLPLSLYWIQAGAMVDSNILRRTSGVPTEEVFRLGLGARKDTYIYGRQMLRLEGRVDGYKYNQFDDLSYIGYGGLAEWHYQLTNDLAGVLGASTRQYQRDISQTQTAVHDVIREHHLVANGAYTLGPSFRFRAGADLLDLKDQLARENELQTLTGILGADYVTPLGNTLGVEYRQAHGDAPVPQTIDPTGALISNDFKERAALLTASYINPFIRFHGRAGHTERDYTQLPERNFSGTTWEATLDWLVTYKTALGFETYRVPRSLIDVAASHVVVNGVAFGPGWAPTTKLNFTARIMRERQEFGGDPRTVLAPDVFPLRLEFVRLFRLGAYWEYTRQIHWQFAIDHGSRESNVLGRDYTYNAVIANVRYLFW